MHSSRREKCNIRWKIEAHRSHLKELGNGKITVQRFVAKLERGLAISHGKAKASRSFKVESTDVKAVRERVGLTQDEFAKLMRVSIKTLQNWEQKRRQPTGPAAALLKIVSVEPKLALRSLHA